MSVIPTGKKVFISVLLDSCVSLVTCIWVGLFHFQIQASQFCFGQEALPTTSLPNGLPPLLFGASIMAATGHGIGSSRSLLGIISTQTSTKLPETGCKEDRQLQVTNKTGRGYENTKCHLHIGPTCRFFCTHARVQNDPIKHFLGSDG